MNRATNTLSPPGSVACAASGEQFTLHNAGGMCVTIAARGAAPISWIAPDRYGRDADVLADALADACADARVPWPRQCRHAGCQGLQEALWEGAPADGGVLLQLQWPKAPAGAPGAAARLDVRVQYRLDDDGSLSIAYAARAAGPTPINFTSSPCFNLNGGEADVGDHMLQIDAGYLLQTDAGGMERGLMAVGGTPFDFRQPAAIGPRLGWPDPQLQLAGGFDHCYWVGASLRAGAGGLRQVARVHDPGSGRCLRVASTQAGLQFYSGKRLGGLPGRAGAPYARHAGFSLAAQACLDPLIGELAAPLLWPGQVFRQTTVYHLSLQA